MGASKAQLSTSYKTKQNKTFKYKEKGKLTLDLGENHIVLVLIKESEDG